MDFVTAALLVGLLLAVLASGLWIGLALLGVGAVTGGHWCTVAGASRFFSFRRSPRTGRMAAAIAIAIAGR
jgi:copper oxidase (laccase) domain-containing protein